MQGLAGLRFRSPTPGRTWLPGAPALCPDVTLSDVGGHGERAHFRRYARSSRPVAWPSRALLNGGSVWGGWHDGRVSNVLAVDPFRAAFDEGSMADLRERLARSRAPCLGATGGSGVCPDAG